MPKFAGLFSTPSPETSSAPTPYINLGQTVGYTERLQEVSAKAAEQPLRYLRSWEEVERALSLVDRAREQGADWDEEEGQAVSFETAQRAKSLLHDLARRADAGGKVWTSAAISATSNGGIHFSWLVAGSRVTLTVFAPHQDTICVTKFRGQTSHRELLSDYGAVGRVVQAFEMLSPPLAGTHSDLR